jgi:hypothetical protein
MPLSQHQHFWHCLVNWIAPFMFGLFIASEELIVLCWFCTGNTGVVLCWFCTGNTGNTGLCKDSWGLLVLSAIVSGGVLIALLRRYCEQFCLLRRGRLLIQKRNSLVGHSSGISTVDLKEEDDLDINSNYWSWITERVAIVVTFTIFSIYLWLSCKSRLLC